MNRKVFTLAALSSCLCVSSALTGCAPGPDESEEVGQRSDATHSWNGYHWARTANPFALKLGDNVGSNWDSYLRSVSDDWSQSTVLDTTVVPGSAHPRNCKATRGMVQVCNASYGSNGWLGVAGVSVSGGHITAAYVKLNDTYFNTAKYDTPAWRNLVTCQEVGHTFGLDHQDETFGNPNLGTCMDYTSDPSTNQHPNQHDYEELGIIYAHLDATTTVGAAVPSSPALAGESPAEWGELVRSKGPMATYFRDLGNGDGVVTHVFWAPN